MKVPFNPIPAEKLFINQLPSSTSSKSELLITKNVVVIALGVVAAILVYQYIKKIEESKRNIDLDNTNRF